MFSSISVEFDNDSIKITEGIKKGNSLSVLKYISVELPKNCIEDGKINNISIVKQLLKNALKNNFVKTQKASFIINSNLVISRKIELPYLKGRKDSKSMIHCNLQDMFFANLKQYIFIYKISGVFLRSGVKYASYIIQGLPLVIYEQYIEIAKSLKLELKKLDISSNCLENIAVNQSNINHKQYDSENINAFIGMNKDTLIFSVLNRGINEFFRIYYFNENVENIERVAEGVGGYSAIYSNTYTEFSQDQSLISVYTDIILRYLKYFYSTSKGKEEVSKIYVYGDKINQEIERNLKSNLDMEIELINDISNINVQDITLQDNFEISNYLICTLALLDNKESSNFLSESQKYHKLRFIAGLAIMSVLLISSFVCAYKGINYLYKSNIVENEIKIMQMFIEDKANIDQNIKIEESKLQVDKLKKYMENALLMSNKIKIEDCVSSDLLIDINASIPNETSVNSVSIDKNNILLICRSNNMNEISMLLNNLRNTEFISNVYIPEVEIGNGNGEFSLTYQVICSTTVIK
ncbi:MAG: pilus assembly protein PilM [Sedimentibacter sp.]